jgi:hypothetical protein
MTDHIHQHPAEEEERRREERRSVPSEANQPSGARVPPSPPPDEYDLARSREKLERVIAK